MLSSHGLPWLCCDVLMCLVEQKAVSAILGDLGSASVTGGFAALQKRNPGLINDIFGRLTQRQDSYFGVWLCCSVCWWAGTLTLCWHALHTGSG